MSFKVLPETYRFTCDGCKLVAPSATRMMPYGWMHISTRTNYSATQAQETSNDYCPGCADTIKNFISKLNT